MSLAPVTARALAPCVHGFFTRVGGVSSGLYESLNCGRGSDDAPGAVAENRRRVAAHLGVAGLVSVSQVHSAHAITVTGPLEDPRPRADALVTDRPGLALAVLSADCAPLLLADPEAGVAAAAHAGWRGALDGVAEETVGAMERLGAARGRIRAVIGPCISQAAYEVGPDFVERFLDDDPETARFFAAGRGDRALFDLPGYLRGRLSAAGVAAEWTGHCTYADPVRFFSHRRAQHRGEADYGRLVSVIVSPAPGGAART